MKKTLTAAGLAVLLLSASAATAQVENWKDIKNPQLRPLRIQSPRKVTLPNGMTVFLQEDHELPLVRGRAVVRGGSREEPAAKAGLVDVYSEVWRTGGTKSKTGDQLDDYLEARAAKVETSGDIDSTAVGFDALKGDLDDVFAVFVEVLRQPEFRDEKISIAKNGINSGIARRNDDASGIAGREMTRIVYGPSSPYARNPEYYTVKSVTRDDLVAWHRQWAHPNNIILGISGDFDSKAMEAKIRKAFGSWARGTQAPAVKGEFTDPKPGVYFVEKEDVNQSNIRLGYLGVRRDSPDYFALEVMNEILGGGFSARLFSNIRSKRGLAYSVGGGVGSDWDHPGMFRISMGTKSETTGAAIEALYEEIRGMMKNPGTAEELQRSRDAILNSYVFRFDTKEEVLDQQMLLAFYGYPDDFITRYQTEIEKVTAADVARVAGKYLSTDKIALVVVGKSADFDRKLSTFGPVTTLDITIPETDPSLTPVAAPAGSPSATASPASADAGRALLGRVAAALGGADKISAIKTIRTTGVMNAVTPQGDVAVNTSATVVLPDRGIQKMVTPMGEVSLVITPQKAFAKTPMGPRDMPASQRDAMSADLRREMMAVIARSSDTGYLFSVGTPVKIKDVTAEVLDIDAAGAKVRWYIDPSTALVLTAESNVTGMQGPVVQTTDFSDWRTIGGIQFPFNRVISSDGKQSATFVVEDIVLNEEVDPKLFE